MENERYLENWRWGYKWITYEIVKWNNDWFWIVYNTYITIPKKYLSENDFKIFNLRWRKFQLTEKSPVRVMYDYTKLEEYFMMSWWITFYEKIYNNEWKIIWIKVWNDYAHIWNTWNENHREDVKESIDNFLSKINLIK